MNHRMIVIRNGSGRCCMERKVNIGPDMLHREQFTGLAATRSRWTEMKLFAQVVRTVVNVVLLPVDVIKDVFTLGGVVTKGDLEPYTIERLKKLAEDEKED